MHTQAKQLKTLLRTVSAKGRNRSGLSVRTERRVFKMNGDSFVEYGDAICHTKPLTNSQISKLVELNKYVKVFNRPELGFALVRL